jgi:hypothetical protein
MTGLIFSLALKFHLDHASAVAQGSAPFTRRPLTKNVGVCRT